MAVSEGMIGDNTGQIGQGLAYVLPETRSDKYLLQLSIDNKNKLYAQRQARARAQLERSENIGKNLTAKFGSPEAWTPYNQLVGNEWNKWTQDAVSLKVKGIDPTQDPTMLKRYNEIKNIALYSNDLKDQYIKARTAIQSNPDKYDYDALDKLEGQYQDALKNPKAWFDQTRGFTPLNPKRATLDELIKDIKPSTVTVNTGSVETKAPNAEQTRLQIMGKLLSDPDKWGPAAKRYGVDLSYYPAVDPKTGQLFNDEPSIRSYVRQMISDPALFQQELAEAGIDPNRSTAAEELVDHYSKVNRSFNNLLNTLGRQVDAKADTGTKRVYDAERMALSREAAQDRRARLGQFLKDKDSNDDREKWIRDIQEGKDVAITNFNAALQEINGTVKHENGITTINIPFTVKEKDEHGETQEVTKIQRIQIGKSTGQAGRIRLNSILNRLKSVGTEKQLKIEGYNFDDDGWNADLSEDEGLLD